MSSQEQRLALLLARRDLWLLVSIAFVDPYHRKRLALLEDRTFRTRVLKAAALAAEQHAGAELGPGELDPAGLAPAGLFSAFDRSGESLETAYRELFGLTALSPQCPACETEFEPNADVTYRSQRLADVAGFYGGFGVQVSRRSAERLDHISVEAEFLYLLLAKEAAAIEVGMVEGEEVSRDARRKFFEEHVGWWVPAFTRLMSRLAPEGFYRELSNLTARVATLERVSLGLHPVDKRLEPATFRR